MRQNREKVWTLFVLPCDTANEGKTIGVETLIRLEAVLDATKKFPVSDIVITAGISPDKESGMIEPFTILMEKKLRELGVKIPIHKSENMKTWTSFEETLEAMRMIWEKNFFTNVLVVSTGFHIYPRLWVMWKILKPPGWKVKFFPAWEGSVDFLHEFLGTFAYILKSFRKKFFNK